MFPPKGQLTLDAARKVVEGLRAASPDFISVTCSAGGSGNGSGGQTAAIAELVQKEAAIPAVAHFTCVSATRASVDDAVEDLRAARRENSARPARRPCGWPAAGRLPLCLRAHPAPEGGGAVRGRGGLPRGTHRLPGSAREYPPSAREAGCRRRLLHHPAVLQQR